MRSSGTSTGWNEVRRALLTGHEADSVALHEGIDQVHTPHDIECPGDDDAGATGAGTTRSMQGLP